MTGIIILLIPIPRLGRLQIPKSQKIAPIGIFCLGSLYGIAHPQLRKLRLTTLSSVIIMTVIQMVAFIQLGE